MIEIVSVPEAYRLSSICRDLQGHPLHPIANDIITAVVRAAEVAPENRRGQLLGIAESILNLFPKLDNEYFQLDWALMQIVARDLLGGQLNAYMFPIYHQPDHRGWAHSKKMVPWGPNTKRPIHLIFFDRQENTPPELQSYPWLVHELAHYALAHQLEHFRACAALTNERVKSWRLASLAVEDRAGQQLIADFQQYWTPREDQADWPHEIAVDAICMVLMGPVYALTLYAHYAEITSEVNAYQIEPDHIPLELRTQAIVQIGDRLGWHREMDPLRDLQRAWERQWPDAAQASRYRNLKDEALIRAAQEVGLTYCDQVGLTPLTPAKFMALGRAAADPGSLDGTALIIAAWWMWQGDQGGPQYQQWVNTLIQDYAE